MLEMSHLIDYEVRPAEIGISIVTIAELEYGAAKSLRHTIRWTHRKSVVKP